MLSLCINSAFKCIKFLNQWLYNLPLTVSVYDTEKKHKLTSPVQKIMIQLLSSTENKHWYVRIINVKNQWKIEYNHKIIGVSVIFKDIIDTLCYIITRYQKKVILKVSVTFSPSSQLSSSQIPLSQLSSHISFNKESTYPSDLFFLSPIYHQVLYWYNFDTMNSEIVNKSQQIKDLLSFSDYMKDIYKTNISPKKIDHVFLDQLIHHTWNPPQYIAFKSSNKQVNVSQVNILLKDQIEEIGFGYAYYTWDKSNQVWKCIKNILDPRKKTTLIQTPQQLQKEFYKIVNNHKEIPINFVVELLTDDVNVNDNHIKSETSNIVFDVLSTYIPGNFKLDKKDNIWRFVYDIQQYQYDKPKQVNNNSLKQVNKDMEQVTNIYSDVYNDNSVDLNFKKPLSKNTTAKNTTDRITIAKISDIRLPSNSIKKNNNQNNNQNNNLNNYPTSEVYKKSIHSAPFLENLDDVKQEIHTIREELKKEQENPDNILNRENFSSYSDLNNLLDVYENRYDKILRQNALVDKWNEVNLSKLKESIIKKK